MERKQAYIEKIEYYLPEKTLTNDELTIIYPEWSAEKIYDKTGIKSRPIASDEETALDLAERACIKLFESDERLKDRIDFLILMTESPDYILPPSSCILQNRLGLRNDIGAFDINLGCSAYIYGLAISKSLIVSGLAKTILLVTSDTYSKYIHHLDKSTRTLFGDAASATVVSDTGDFEIGEFDLGTNGADYDKLIIPAGMSRMPSTDETKTEFTDENGYTRSKENLFMDGTAILSFAIDVVPKTVKNILKKYSCTINDIDMFIFHQANKYMLTYLKKKLRIPDERFFIDLEDIGNTVSSSIPIALKNALVVGSSSTISKIMLVGFGVGLSWGSVIVENEKKERNND